MPKLNSNTKNISLLKVGYTLSQHIKYVSYLDELKEKFYDRYNSFDQNHSADNIKLSDLDLIKNIGVGGFGLVYLAKNNQAELYYALKVMEKKKIFDSNHIDHTINEKRIQMNLNFPFIVTIQASFKDNVSLYILQPYIPGGELTTLLRKLGQCSELLTKFYISQITLALEYLHHLDLIYRDLKLENILLTEEGYLKLTDFGFCKILRNYTATLCGSPEYLAPEMVLCQKYNQSVDWWAMGVLTFELITGYPPFFASHPITVYKKITTSQFKSPPNLNGELKDLLRGLLQKNPKKRLGSSHLRSYDIKSHIWFKDIDWQAIFSRKIIAPYKPLVCFSGDSSNFDEIEYKMLKRNSKCLYSEEFKDF